MIGGPKDFFGSVILGKRDRIFLGHKKNQGFLWVLHFSSAQINNKISAIYSLCGIFGCAKNVGIFLSRQILKLELFRE